MTNTFVRSCYILTLLFAIIVAVTGNRMYPKSQLNGEQVGHPILQSALSLKGGPLYKTCSFKQYVGNCNNCDSTCKHYGKIFWGECSGVWPVRECYCYWECV